jgi:hypothetical protein
MQASVDTVGHYGRRGRVATHSQVAFAINVSFGFHPTRLLPWALIARHLVAGKGADILQ